MSNYMPGSSPEPGFHEPSARNCGTLFSPNLTFGVLFILAGTALLFERLGYLNAPEFFYYWPLALVIFGVGLLARRDSRAGIGCGRAGCEAGVDCRQ